MTIILNKSHLILNILKVIFKKRLECEYVGKSPNNLLLFFRSNSMAFDNTIYFIFYLKK